MTSPNWKPCFPLLWLNGSLRNMHVYTMDHIIEIDRYICLYTIHQSSKSCWKMCSYTIDVMIKIERVLTHNNMKGLGFMLLTSSTKDSTSHTTSIKPLPWKSGALQCHQWNGSDLERCASTIAIKNIFPTLNDVLLTPSKWLSHLSE